jgi:hypothetical protein
MILIGLTPGRTASIEWVNIDHIVRFRDRASADGSVVYFSHDEEEDGVHYHETAAEILAHIRTALAAPPPL